MIVTTFNNRQIEFHYNYDQANEDWIPYLRGDLEFFFSTSNASITVNLLDGFYTINLYNTEHTPKVVRLTQDEIRSIGTKLKFNNV